MIRRPRVSFFPARMFVYIVLLLLQFSAALPTTSLAAGSPPLILAVHPYLNHDELVTRFTPLADFLSRSLGRPVSVRVGRTYQEHIDAIGKNTVDIAYMGPVPYVMMTKKYGAKPLLARQVINNDPYLRGEIVVRQDSPIRTLSELKGRCFVFGDPNSTMSSVLPKKMLKDKGVGPNELGRTVELEGHENVAMSVLSGDCDAGAVKSEVYARFAPKGLRVLAELPLSPDHIFVASSALTPELVEQLRSAFQQLNVLPEGQAIRASIHPQMTALVVPKDSDYDPLRALLFDKPAGKKR